VFGSYALALGRGEHRHGLGARAASLGLPVRIESRELLLVASERAACLCDNDAILIGQAFDDAGERLTSLPAEFAALDQSDDPHAAFRHIWGNYALFFASSNQTIVYREPSGSVPVYRCSGEPSTIFVSDAEIASRLGVPGQPEIDRKFVVHWLQYPFLRTARTGLQNVTELLPGMCISSTRSDQWTEAAAWHPAEFVTRDRTIDDPAEAAERLREMANWVIAAQPRGSNIVLRLSGGLDSSIIAACLSKAERQYSCINFATRARDGDERGYARDVATKFGVKLIEVGEPQQISLAMPSHRSFRPSINPLLEPFERAIVQAAEELGAALLIDGGGGDNLFCSIPTAAPAIDALRSGSLKRTRAAMADIATRANCTVWDVLRAACRRASRRRTAWKEDRSFLLADALLLTCEPHPWLQGLGVPPGKREHVEALVHIQHFLDRAPSSIGILHPLLAQPLLELCLRIPSWLWVRGGRDRAVARDAFAGLVPKAVLERRMKGSLQSLLYRSFAQLRPEMRDMLLAGELARFGIIDTAAIDQALIGDEWMTDQVQLRISEMVALELWLRSWRSEPASSSIGS
jgi:asparagine synthase (glutamine-hydrolysing)